VTFGFGFCLGSWQNVGSGSVRSCCVGVVSISTRYQPDHPWVSRTAVGVTAPDNTRRGPDWMNYSRFHQTSPACLSVTPPTSPADSDSCVNSWTQRRTVQASARRKNTSSALRCVSVTPTRLAQSKDIPDSTVCYLLYSVGVGGLV